MKFQYDVIVVGGGHAGCEAAVAAARMGVSTLLITSDMNRVAQMSCNPAVGGIAKGQIVREIDALGGQMGKIADLSSVQFRMLNRSKGPAVWSPRVQSDRTRFIDEWRKVLDSTPNLNIFQDTVTKLDIVKEGDGSYVIKGVLTSLGMRFDCKRLILTNGTFLNGKLHFGEVQIDGGRISENASYGISNQLRALGFEVERMKTGTPPRLDGNTIDFSLCEEQRGDGSDGSGIERKCFQKFSFIPTVKSELKQRSCHIVYTNKEVHEVLHANIERSPLYNGQIQSIGPRYCPSIETKIVTFADKDSHQLFLEPEGETTQEYYVNGFSSSLPWDVQIEALKKIPALANAHFYRPGYAIEYDFFPPTQLTHDLQTKLVSGLYFAGQINGTTGYEEAAAQGLMAGINAALSLKGAPPLVLKRDQAYIGVLIDDLVLKGVDEPYRMFTSRAEYRILLRQDDADLRLTPLGRKIGLVDDERWEIFQSKKEFIDKVICFSKTEKLPPSEDVNSYLSSHGSKEVKQRTLISDLVKRPGISLKELLKLSPEFEKIKFKDDYQREEVVEEAEIFMKYEGYIDREKELAEKTLRLENVRIPATYDFMSLKSLSTEARQKLTSTRPSTIGEASRIPGVSPADIQILLMQFRK